MSTNLAPKDKIVLEIGGKPPGRISLDPTDSIKLADLFARAQPGDTFTGTFTATLDESGSKNVSLSLVKITVDEPEESENPMQAIADQEDEEDEASEAEPAAVTMLKNDDGVSEGAAGTSDDNLPGDTMMTH